MNFLSLSIAQLKTLAAILEHRNLTRAAASLGSSQSVLSKQLAQFRDAFNDPLLVRQGGRYLLTERAMALSEPLARVLADLDSLAQPEAFSPSACTRVFTLAGSDYVAEHILPGLISALAPLAPGVSINYVTWQADRYDWLAEGKVDLATSMLEDAPTEFHGRVIGDDVPVCCVHRDHPLARNAQISLADYLAWGHIRISGGGDKDGFIDTFLKAQQMTRAVRLSVPFFSVALDVVAHSQNLLTIPRHLAEHSAAARPITWRPLSFLSHRFRYWVLWHRRTHAAPEQQWFRHLVYQHCQTSPALNPAQT